MVVHEYGGNISRDGVEQVSVVMIMYNRKEYTKQAVESLLNQDYPNLEIVISDDKSDDGALEVALEVVKDYKGPHRVVVNVNEKNLGLCGNFAAAMSLAHGNWIVACGGDDVQHADRVSRIVEYAHRYPTAVVVGSGANTIDSAGVQTGSMGVEAPCLYRRYVAGDFKMCSPNVADSSATFSLAAGACAAYRKEIFSAVAFPVTAVFEDLVMDFRGIQMGDMLLVPDRLLDYRIHQFSVCSGGRKSSRRAERRCSRRRISASSYVSWKGVWADAIALQLIKDARFFKKIEVEVARSLLWSFREKQVFSKNAKLYQAAYKVARREYSFFSLLRGAEGRGVAVPFLAVAMCSFASMFVQLDFKRLLKIEEGL